MSDFDNLFDEQLEKRKPQMELSIEGFDKEVINQRKNGLLFLIYIIVNVVFTFGALIYSSSIYPNPDNILESFEIVGPTLMDPVYEADAITSIDFSTNVVNNSSKDIQEFYITIELYDINDNLLGTLDFYEENFLTGATLPVSGSITTTVEAASFDVGYGIDLSSMFYITLGTVQAMFGAILFIIIDKEAFKANFKEFRRRPNRYFGQIAIGFVVVFAALILASTILDILGVNDTSQNEETIRSYFEQDGLRLVMLFFMLCIFTPIVEEVVFRKVVFNFIEPKTNSIVAIIGTGVVFGLMHVITYGDFIQSLPYILMGITFGWIYHRSKKNLLVTIGVHFMNNFFTFLMYILMLYGLYQF